MNAEQQIRFMIGDLVIQNIIMSKRIEELTAQLAAKEPPKEPPSDD